MPVSADDRDKTAFVSLLGLFRFTTRPFGLCGAPAMFQRLMDSVICGQHLFARAYLDDIVVFSRSHLSHLKEVFNRLQAAGLTVKLKKCQFGMEDCSYLGHQIGGGTMRPEEDKIITVRDYL